MRRAVPGASGGECHVSKVRGCGVGDRRRSQHVGIGAGGCQFPTGGRNGGRSRRHRSCRRPLGSQDRREVAAGTRAYSIGFEDGRFYANGWHITGEMGGVWTPPLKLRRRRVVRARRPVGRAGDQVHQRPGLHALRPAGHRRPEASQRTDFVPDGRARRAVRPHDHQPGRGPDREAVRRRPLRADGAVPVGVHRRHAQRQRQHPRQGQLQRPEPRVHRRRRAARRARYTTTRRWWAPR